MPVYIEPLSGYGFTPGVRTDLETTAERFQTEPPPMNLTEYERYMNEFKVNVKDMARQAIMTQSRSQSMAKAVRNAAESAVHHRFRTYWRVRSSTKVGNVKPHVELDVDDFLDSGANPYFGTPQRVRDDPNWKPVLWHWDPMYRRRLRSEWEELDAGWPSYDECFASCQLCWLERWAALEAKRITNY